MTTTRPRSLPADRPPYGLAALAATIVLALYVLTIAPTTQFWDTSEYIAAAKGLGIPHPPGNPLFVIMAHVWGYLPLAAGYALRINLFSAVMSAGASGFLFLVTERWLRPVLAERWPRMATTFAGVLIGATAFTVWNQSVVNEKVYTVSLFSIGLILWLAVRWGDLAEGQHRDGLLILIAYFLALTSTNHMMGVLVAPAVGLYVVATDWRQVLRPWVLLLGLLLALAVSNAWAVVINGPSWARALVILLVAGAFVYVAWREPVEFRQPALYLAILAVVIGISLNYTFLPIRAAQFPAINEGEPTNWHALWAVLSREQYQKPPVTQRMADFPSQIGNYLQYFSWQWGRDWGAPVRRGLAVLFGGLGLFGMVEQWRKDRRAAWAMIGLMFTVTLLLIYYLNFRYGFSYRPGEHLYLVSFLLWGVWSGIGLGALFRGAAETLRARLTPRAAWLAASPVLLFACIPLVGNRLTASRAHERLAQDFAYDLLQSVAPYGILITAGDNDLFPLWFAQEVEGVRRDVVLVNQSLMNTDWHIRQTLRRPVYPFDLEHAVGPWKNDTVAAPTNPVLRLSMAGVDSLPLVFQLDKKTSFRFGDVTATLDAGVYERQTLITLMLIRDNLGKRPIYFARTTGPTGDQLGLTQYLLTDGFGRRLMPQPIAESDSIVFVQPLGWIDLPVSEKLLFDVYHPESAARARPRGWLDTPSENILTLYYVTYAMFGEILKQMADSTKPEEARLGNVATDFAQRMLANTSFGRR
jgi:4-amino-4-deoxy-L-arabinose transferase-like glycosyltransferase